MVHKALFSSQKEDWATPQGFFDKLDHVFNFKLDACADRSNKKCNMFFSKKDNALTQDWSHYNTVWLNPPYGRTMGSWMQKAYDESLKGAVVVCLVPARTDTKWWHEWVDGKGQVTFVKGRLKFGGSKHAAPFPSAVVVYGLDVDRIVNGSPSD